MTVVPWPKEHKRETRRRIVASASAAFREQGVHGIGLAEIMERAGLTHGGFYAHFASKDELLSEAIELAAEETNAYLSGSMQPGSSNALRDIAKAYLDALHIDHPERGCPVAALGGELTRSSPRVRRTLAAGIHKRLERLAALDNGATPQARRRRAAGALACMVGGVLLARGLKDAQAKTFVDNCLAFLDDALAQ